MRKGYRRLGDRVVRRPRQAELAPVRVKPHVRRRVMLPAATSALLALTLSFAVAIAVGAGLLLLPFASEAPGRAPIITALFTATSAVCVTGLVVVESATYWTGFGQAVIAVLMFVGGLGIMTAGIVVLASIGRRITLSDRLIVRETMGATSLGDLVRLGRYILIFAVVTQAVGAVVLFVRFIWQRPFGEALWDSVFHSISAFNNAGFTIFPDSASLSAYRSDHAVLAIIGVLIIVGGLSFPVLNDLVHHRRPARWSLDTRLVVLGTLALWGIGALATFMFEFRNPGTLGNLPLDDQLSNAAFQSLTSRTAGFSTIDFGQTRPGNDFLFMLLMFVGGASGSTAGGIKVNTAMVLVAAGFAAIRGRPRPEVYRRELPYAQVGRALAIFLLAIVGLFVAVVALAVSELHNVEQGRFGFLDVLFEAVSALGTTGLSTGITPILSDAGKVIVTIAMYLGRLGPLTFALGLALRERHGVYRFAQERVRIG